MLEEVPYFDKVSYQDNARLKVNMGVFHDSSNSVLLLVAFVCHFLFKDTEYSIRFSCIEFVVGIDQ